MVMTTMEKISIAPGAIFFYGSQLDFLTRGEDSFLPNHLHMMPLILFSPSSRLPQTNAATDRRQHHRRGKWCLVRLLGTVSCCRMSMAAATNSDGFFIPWSPTR
jgi:hypothetical protein